MLQRDEITTDYISATELCLIKIKQRRTSLKRRWDFISEFPTCGPGQEVRALKNKTAEQTDKFRVADEQQAVWVQAKAALADINFGHIPIVFKQDEMVEQVKVKRQEQFTLLARYINALLTLRFYDSKLAQTFEARGLLHEQGISLVEHTLQKGATAPAWLPADIIQALLRSAQNYWRSKQKVFMRCFGKDHPDTQEAGSKVEQLVHRLVPCSFLEDDEDHDWVFMLYK